MPHPVDLATMQAAHQRLAPFCHETPAITCATLDKMAGCSLFLKAENLQKCGAFKARGATNAVQSLGADEARRGVLTHSSGNHGQALAWAAGVRGIPAHIVMPNNAPLVKQAAVRGYGGRVILCEPTLEARESTAAAIAEETGAQLIHPYDDARIIAGQASVAIELIKQVPDLDAVVVPIGGGGLISGMALALAELAPRVRVIAAEPAGADDAFRSKEAGRLLPQTAPNTIAKGLLTSLGALTWPVLRDHIERVITVDDEQIKVAMRLIFERAKLVVEPSAAVSLAVALSPAFAELAGMQRVAVVLTGGNVDLGRLPW